MTTATKNLILRPATFGDDSLPVGASLFHEQVPGYFDEYVIAEVGEIKECSKQRLDDPDRANRKAKIVGAFSAVETGSYQEFLDGVATSPLYGSYFVESEPDHPDAISAEVFIPNHTLLTLRLTGPLPQGSLDSVLQEALAILAEAGYIERPGCSIHVETGKRVHVTDFNGQVLAANVLSSDAGRITGRTAYTVQVADPRQVVGS